MSDRAEGCLLRRGGGHPLRLRVRVAGVVRRGGALLVTGYRGPGGVFYSLPGGGQQTGEPASTALVRELAEETGCAASLGRPLHVVETFFPDPFRGRPLHSLELYFEASLDGEPRLGFESPDSPEARLMTEVTFRPEAELDGLPIYPRGIVEALRRDAPPGYLTLPATENELGDLIDGVAPWSPERVRVRAAALIHDDAGRLLISDNGSHAALPGGGLEADETLPRCLEREILEETGLIVKARRLLHVNDNFFRDPFFAPEGLHELGFYWLCELRGGSLRPRLSESGYTLTFRWLRPEDAPDLLPAWLPAALVDWKESGWGAPLGYGVSGDFPAEPLADNPVDRDD